MSRFKNTPKVKNANEAYLQIFSDKKIKSITHYKLFELSKFKPTAEMNFVIHTFQPFDKLHLLSEKYYGSPDYGWLICYTNAISSELEISIGTSLRIYFPLQSFAGLF